MTEITQGTLINLDGKTWSLNLHCVGETEGAMNLKESCPAETILERFEQTSVTEFVAMVTTDIP